jgi:regulator of sirC expression with transglutaminase-like and TPR domain
VTMNQTQRERLLMLAARPGEDDLAEAALHLGALEYPSLDVPFWMAELERLSGHGEAHVRASVQPGDTAAHLQALGHFLFEQEGFTGNLADYDNPRNSFLNDVLAHRTGIPITLSVLYMHVGRRAGLWLEGINFPGHYLVRCRGLLGEPSPSEDLVLDPFHGGIVLSERDCRTLLEKHAGDEVRFTRALLTPAFKSETLVRMLLNLKRAFARLRSFGQAREVSSLLLALDPGSLAELRDRGLLSYQLGRFGEALADLERYLSLTARQPRAEAVDEEEDEDNEEGEEFEALWEHVKNLRRRVASLN